MKTKALISFAVTAELICVFIAYAKNRFFHDAAHILHTPVSPSAVYGGPKALNQIKSPSCIVEKVN